MYCIGRSKSSKQSLSRLPRPPAEIVGLWFHNATALEKKMGTVEMRRRTGLGAQEQKSQGYLIVDGATRSIEFSYRHGRKTAIEYAFEGTVVEWGSSIWRCSDDEMLVVTDKIYVPCNGKEILVAMTVNKMRLERSFEVELDEGVVCVSMTEAKYLGWASACLEALAVTLHSGRRGSSPRGRRSLTAQPVISDVHKPQMEEAAIASKVLADDGHREGDYDKEVRWDHGVLDFLGSFARVLPWPLLITVHHNTTLLQTVPQKPAL